LEKGPSVRGTEVLFPQSPVRVKVPVRATVRAGARTSTLALTQNAVGSFDVASVAVVVTFGEKDDMYGLPPEVMTNRTEL
jgi:hypothetical protein